MSEPKKGTTRQSIDIKDKALKVIKKKALAADKKVKHYLQDLIENHVKQ